ncbi:hypothetical protein BofuT4_uP156100.1 [Botrytis cinerea T4]|uniref:Uncharacterized protein n=1 Tax=Botryotinia fuckeliana (strain T4) TaxID=999810 RepID=G2YUB6_BOTF4|nr:hypothetical protein BofuT4_uP156100.1 [Botrytis cinerea T4]
MNNGKEEWRWTLRRFHVDIRRKKKPAEAIPFSFFPAAMSPVGPRKTANIQSVEKGVLHTISSAQQPESTGSNVEAQYWKLVTLLALA